MRGLEDHHIKRQVPRNLVWNILFFTATTIIGLWIVPYLREHLGIAAYGLAPLAMALVGYVSLITQSFNQAVLRFLIIAIQRRDWQAANRTFNTAFFFLLFLCLVQIPLMLVFAWLCTRFLTIPPELVTDAGWMMIGTFGAFLLSLFGVFTAPLAAFNRIDYRRMLDIARLLCRALLIATLFWLFSPNLRYVGLGTFLASLVELVIACVMFHIISPELRINPRDCNRALLRDLLHMGSWVTVDAVGVLLFLKLDLIVINKFLGTEAGGNYAPLLMLVEMTRTMAGLLGSIGLPVLMLYYSKGDIGRLVRFLNTMVKVMGALLAILLGVACGLAKPFLALWLGSDTQVLAPVLIILLAHLPFNLCITPMLAVARAHNRVKVPGIMTFVMGIANAGLTVLCVLTWPGGLIGAAFAGAVSLTLKNLFFTPVYTAHVVNRRKSELLRPIMTTLVVFAAMAAASWLTARHFAPSGWLSLMSVGAILGSAGLAAVYAFVLTRSERRLCGEMLTAQYAKPAREAGDVS